MEVQGDYSDNECDHNPMTAKTRETAGMTVSMRMWEATWLLTSLGHQSLLMACHPGTTDGVMIVKSEVLGP
jgi:hypothetical protein